MANSKKTKVDTSSAPEGAQKVSVDAALRFNKGKPKLSILLDAPNALLGVTKVLEHGADKYGKRNWKKGLPTSEIVDSLLRHLIAFSKGENVDEESGDARLLHVDQILANALFLAEMMRIHPEMDDREATNEAQ